MHAIDFLPYHFFVSCQNSFIGNWIKEATWIFAIIETIHIMGLSVLLGTTLVVDLRLLGFGLRRSTASQVSHELEPWTMATLIVVVGTGVCLYMSEAVRLSVSGPFFYKMIFFTIAILLHFTIHWRATSKNAIDGSTFGKVAACLSLVSWLSVALAGRAIAFL
jgi:hypothetical protein